MSRVIKNILLTQPSKNAIIKKGGLTYMVLYRHKKPYTCTVIDAEDAERLSQHSWCLGESKSGQGYVHGWIKNNGERKMFTMQAFLIGKKEGLWIDHKNRNRLDNRKKNLRHVTPEVQNINRFTHFGKGYYFNKKRNGWFAYVGGNKRKGIPQIIQGPFLTEQDAIEARGIMLNAINIINKSPAPSFK